MSNCPLCGQNSIRYDHYPESCLSNQIANKDAEIARLNALLDEVDGWSTRFSTFPSTQADHMSVMLRALDTILARRKGETDE